MSFVDLLNTSTTRSTRGRVPVAGLALNGETLTGIQVQEFSMSCSEANHDTGSLKAQSTELEDTSGFVNGVLSLRYGNAPRTEGFSGYIVDVKEETGSGGALTFTLSLMGPTKSMSEGLPNFWSNKAATSAIRDLSHKDYLGYIGHDHTYVWRALAQTDQTDWAFLVSLARRIGYIIFNRHGVVMCYNPVDLFTQSGTYCRLVAGSNRDAETDRQLIEFQPGEISDVEENTLGTKYGYFTTAGAVQIATQPGKFRGYRFDPRITVRDQEEGAQYIKAVDMQLDDWTQKAVARVWGDADICPGMCVEVVTTNRRFLRDKYDGKWLVRATQHQMDRQQYQLLLYLNRPNNTKVQTVPYRPFWQEGGGGRAKPILTMEGTVSSEDLLKPGAPKQSYRWVSSWNDRTLRSVL